MMQMVFSSPSGNYLALPITASRSSRLTLLPEIKRLHPQQCTVEDPPGMTQMLGSKWAMAAFQRGDDPRTIQRRWDEELRAWHETQERYRLYRD